MIKTIRRCTTALWLMFLVGMWSSGSVSAKQQEVRILSMNDREMTLEFALPPFEMETIQGPDGKYQRIRLHGLAKTSRAGYPELPLKTVLLQAPKDGAIEVLVLEDIYETVQDCQIYPVPVLGLSERGEPSTEFVKDADLYSSSILYPEEPIEIGSRSVLRGTSVARLKIYPFQWNPMTKELRYHKKIRIMVSFEHPSIQSTINKHQSTITNTAFEKLKQETIINYKKEPQDAKRSTTRTADLRQSSIVPPHSIPPHALRMEVREERIYRLTYDDLLEAGLPTGIDASTFQLFNLGNEAAIKVVQGGSSFGAGDYVEFYAQAIDNQYTDANVYWLYWGQETGKRMGETDGTVTGGGTRPETFADTIHVEENHTIWEGMSGAPEEDYWFREKFTAPKSSDYTIDIPSPDTTAVEATVKVCFRGRSTATPHPNHHTLIYLNGTSIGDAFWDGDIAFVQEMTVSPGLFIDGSNTLTIDCPGNTGAVVDIVYFNWIEVEYARYFEAMDDQLKFTVSGNERLEIEVQGLSGPDIRLFDITDSGDVKEVVNISIETDGPSYKAIFEDQVAGKTYYVLTAGRIRQPENPILWQSANLESPANGADWIVITTKNFLASVEPLRLLRENQGLRVKVVSIEDIYNEFNYGLTDPKAIKGLLQYAYDNWERPALVYVFLIGDANMDFRDYWGSGKQNIIPPHLCHTDLGVTPEDNWYVCMDGPDDVLPDMFIGRMPASRAEMVAAGINKITGFENSTWPALEKVLLTADDNEMAFEDLNETLVPYLPPEFGVDKVYLRLYANVNDATQDIISRIDQGMIVTNYVGHGSVTNWTGEYMFDSGDVLALTNSDRLTFMTAMTCLNGYFSQPFHYCLAEEFVAAEGKGAIGAFASSGLGYAWEHEILDPELFSILFDQGNSILGSLTTEAKIAAYAQGVTEDIVKTFTLFGDPACRLKFAADTINGTPATSVDEDTAYSFTPTANDIGDILAFSITNKPAWASFDTGTGSLTGMPNNDDVGIYSGIVITVTDGKLTASLPPFDIEVIYTNDEPTISGTPATSVDEDTAYSFTPTANDIGDILAFSITNKPAWASFDTGTGSLTGMPNNDDVGIYSGIVITVTDGKLTASLPPFDLTVMNLVIPGDIDNSGTIDLRDAILAIQSCAGIIPPSTVYKEADVNGDNKIGLEEVIYILQTISGLRQ